LFATRIPEIPIGSNHQMPNVSHCGSEFDFIVVAKLCQAIHQLVLQALIQATDVGDVWGV
jgi:hypothetical protein